MVLLHLLLSLFLHLNLYRVHGHSNLIPSLKASLVRYAVCSKFYSVRSLHQVLWILGSLSVRDCERDFYTLHSSFVTCVAVHRLVIRTEETKSP